MKKFEVLYVPIGVPTFHLESAQIAFKASTELIQSIEPEAVVPNEILFSIDILKSFIENRNPDMIILQNITFANSAYATEVFKNFDVPVLLWTLKEPVIDGGRLRLNSLTGAFSAGFSYRAFKDHGLFYMYGSPNELSIKNQLAQTIKVAKLKHSMKHMNLLMIGHTPQGFGFGRALDLEMTKTFGVNLLAIESRELTQIAKNMKFEDAAQETDETHQKMVGLDQTVDQNKKDFIKLYKAYKDYIKQNNIKAIASRCWPDFFTDYGTPVCGVLGMLNDENIAAACETDAYGALSMYIGQQLTQIPSYLGDPVSIDEPENTITFWHCGTAACSLARQETGAFTGVHPNRKIGPTMEFGLRPSKQATLFRIGRKPDGTFRFFLAKGEILDKPQQFLGTSMVVKVEAQVKPMITQMVKEGWEPHFVVLYKDVIEELTILAEMLNIEIANY
jgi:L-fucose isomerase-like protein